MQRTFSFVLVLVAVLVFAFASPIAAQDAGDKPPCLPQEVLEGEVPVGKHDHAYILVIVAVPSWDASLPGGIKSVSGLTPPANAGLSEGCIREIHTHDRSGVLHIESVDPAKEHMLTEVFALFGYADVLSIEENGRRAIVIADGEIVPEPRDLVLRNNMRILVILPN